MEPNEWTPARGWMIALGKAAYRGGIIFVGLMVLLYLTWPVIYEIMSMGMATMLFLIAMVVLGSVAGFVLAYGVAWNLKEDSALEGWRLLVPVLVIVTTAEVGACYLAAAFRGTTPAMLIIPLCGMILWGWVGCFVKLILI